MKRAHVDQKWPISRDRYLKTDWSVKMPLHWLIQLELHAPSNGLLTTPILEIARAYGLRPQSWLLLLLVGSLVQIRLSSPLQQHPLPTPHPIHTHKTQQMLMKHRGYKVPLKIMVFMQSSWIYLHYQSPDTVFLLELECLSLLLRLFSPRTPSVCVVCSILPQLLVPER